MSVPANAKLDTRINWLAGARWQCGKRLKAEIAAKAAA
jgi:hypothetical protein